MIRRVTFPARWLWAYWAHPWSIPARAEHDDVWHEWDLSESMRRHPSGKAQR